MNSFKKLIQTSLLALISFSALAAQPECDSLRRVWKNEGLSDTVRLKTVYDLAWDCFLFTNPDSTYYYAKQQQKLAEEIGNTEFLLKALNAQGTSFWVKGDFPNALGAYEQCLEIHQKEGNTQGLASILGNMGLIYTDQGNYPQALDHQQRSLSLRQKMKDSTGMSIAYTNLGNIYAEIKEYALAIEHYAKATKIDEALGRKEEIALNLNNIGLVYYYLKDYEQALQYYERSLTLLDELGNRARAANSMDNIGSVYFKKGEFDEALKYHFRSLKLNEEVGATKGMAIGLVHIGTTYIEKLQFEEALKHCARALQLAEESGAIKQQKDACSCLYKSNLGLHRYKEALDYFERSATLKDSLFNEENTKKLTQLQMQFEFDKIEAANRAEQEKKDALAAAELRRHKLERNGFIGGFTIVVLFAGVFFVQRNRISREKERSEDLLLNILPEETAHELKEKGRAEAQHMDEVSVLFTDFKGFTALSESVTPKELVADLHKCFSAFDHICEKYGIEKIKTIGDAYMAAGGLPTPNKTHAEDVIRAALEMAEVIEKGKANKKAAQMPFFEIRIGVHTGPVVAGIVGVKKFQYDIWGDTVNTASRMESSGEVGKVNISEATFDLLKDDPNFHFEHRGKVTAKGKGNLDMYFVNLA